MRAMRIKMITGKLVGYRAEMETRRKKEMVAKNASVSKIRQILLLPFLDVLREPLQTLEETLTCCRATAFEMKGQSMLTRHTTL